MAFEPAVCRCYACDPDLHEGCSADCFVFDCTSPEACCNSGCLKEEKSAVPDSPVWDGEKTGKCPES